MVVHKHGEILYSGLKLVVTDHLIEKVRYFYSALKKQVCCFFFPAEPVAMERNEFVSHCSVLITIVTIMYYYQHR